MMIRQRLLQAAREVLLDVLLICTGAPALLALFLYVCMLLGCAAQRSGQTWSDAPDVARATGDLERAWTPPYALPPTAPAAAMGPPAPERSELDELKAQQAGLVNLLSKVDQRAEATATAIADLRLTMTGLAYTTDTSWKSVVLQLGTWAGAIAMLLRMVTLLHRSMPIPANTERPAGRPP